ncbi:LAMI_0G14224g1_1 [Lachancea mirantina]|uniref:Potassium transport protein n=1 Tax=Lachancea mirantina TaxID=1230905 RepID=A0A1G4KC91_9SACH|nr:LAMI_0G14224g1_1 [Lachancea mirantina]
MGFWRTVSRRPTLTPVNFRYRKTVGHKVRDFIEWLGHVVRPFAKHVLPNFIAVHYFYIISMAIIGSILMYPVKNFPYIDILFMATGAVTQGGLNTVNVNDMRLYQQIVLTVLCFFTTPIWIHGGLAFVRLYWFERYFDGIKEWSKQNFRIARTRTLMQREATRTMSRRKASGAGNNEDFQSKLFSGQMVNREEDNNQENHEMTDMRSTGLQKSSEYHAEPTRSGGDGDVGVKFGKMPKPGLPDEKLKKMEKFKGRRQSGDISPSDMLRSIAMLQNQHRESDNEDLGPPLVISGPTERSSSRHVHDLNGEAPDASRSHTTDIQGSSSSLEDSAEVPKGITEDDERDVYSQPQSYNGEESDSHPENPQFQGENEPTIQFEITKPPIGPHSSTNRVQSRKSAVRRLRPKIFRKFSSSKSLGHRIRQRLRDSDEDGNDADLEDEGSDSADELKENSPERELSASEEHNSDPAVESIHSASAVQYGDTVGKDAERSYTFDPSQKSNLDTLARSPSFQDIIYKRWKDERKKRGRFLHGHKGAQPNLLRSLSGRDLSRNRDRTSLHRQRTENTMTDEEEGYYGLTFENAKRPPHLKRMSTNYLSGQPRIGRNSTFVGLNDAQKTELGGVEYRATKLLCRLLVIYYFGFHVLGIILICPWITNMNNYIKVVREDGVSPAWWGVFTPMSAFNDLGLTLTPDSMTSFNKAIYPLIIMMWFIVIGNTGFPILLRFIIWILFRISPELSSRRESLGFLLDHPRRCFTLLFPRAPTWWLLLILVALNVTDLVLFIILDLTAAVVDGLSSGFKVLDGLFQAISTRTAGFTVLNLAQLHPAVQVSYMLMMYVSVLPLAISIRRTNVYEEQSLGVYVKGNEDSDNENQAHIEKQRLLEDSPKSFIGAHLRRQLSFDLWFLFLGLFIICISEGGKIKDPKMPDFTVFQVLFEIVSAYGCVGLSLGYPNTDTSFSAQFNTLSKLIMISMLIRGRHRGLPYKLDRAIILPSNTLERRDRLEESKSQGAAGGTEDPLLGYLRRHTKPFRHRLGSVFQPRNSAVPSSPESQAAPEPPEQRVPDLHSVNYERSLLNGRHMSDGSLSPAHSYPESTAESTLSRSDTAVKSNWKPPTEMTSR